MLERCVKWQILEFELVTGKFEKFYFIFLDGEGNLMMVTLSCVKQIKNIDLQNY